MCFIKDILLDFVQIVFLYHRNIEDKKFKRVRTKALIKSFRNREPVNPFEVFHFNVTSVI